MKEQTHYLPNGKIYKGDTHKSGGRLMSGKTHTAKSQFLTHTPPKTPKTK